MTFIADLHLHSSYARATSKELNFENLTHWAKLKGIDLLSSSDFTHPAWFRETCAKLRAVEVEDESEGTLYEFNGLKFVLGTEVNCTYRQGNKSRRLHILIFAPSLAAVEKINRALAARGNLESDGRPTLGISARDLTGLLLEIDPRCIIVPAHIWTPWFSVYGSKGGFDSLEECFQDMSKYIHAVETGLSSDPAMNWRVRELDDRTIVSFSDAHSLPKMGRELTVFQGDLTYRGLKDALEHQKVEHTIEFFPEEGRYHFSGHRACGVRQSPEDTRREGSTCPGCGRELTLGVLHRVEGLADREVAPQTDEEGYIRWGEARPPFRRMVPLQEVLAESLGVGTGTKGVQSEYAKLVAQFGNELAVLMNVGAEEIAGVSGGRVAEGVMRARRGDILVDPGYDGVYGSVSIWPRGEEAADRRQLGLFDSPLI